MYVYGMYVRGGFAAGTGQYPAEKLGSVDGQDILFFGKHLLKLNKLKHQATNLISLLSNAVSWSFCCCFCFVLFVGICISIG